MRIGVYGRPEHPATAALASGLAAVGHRVSWRRPSVFTPDQGEREFAGVVVLGLHKGEAMVAAHYRSLGVPVLVLDLAYLRREWDGPASQFQLGLGGLCWLPPFPCPTDRWRRLGLELHPAEDGGTFVLVVGQRPKDASHNLGREAYLAWLDATIATLRAATDRPIVWRPHPRSPDVMPTVPVDAVSDPRVTSIAEAMQGTHAVVTYNSTVGTEALIAGVPVVCDPAAMYAPWAETDLARIESPHRPTDAARLDYLARLGYAQWSLAELQSGEAARFLVGVLQGEMPVPPVPESVLVGGNLADVVSDTITHPLAPKPRRSRRRVA